MPLTSPPHVSPASSHIVQPTVTVLSLGSAKVPILLAFPVLPSMCALTVPRVLTPCSSLADRLWKCRTVNSTP